MAMLTKRKKYAMQRLRLMLSSLLRTLAWEPASQIILRDCCREIRDKTRYRGVFAGDKCSWTSKLTANHKNRHIELMNLVFFYVWKDARVWAYWNFSFDMILSGLGPVFCFFFLHPEWLYSCTSIGYWNGPSRISKKEFKWVFIRGQ